MDNLELLTADNTGVNLTIALNYGGRDEVARAVKRLAPEGDGSLFRWVAVLTGSKNAVKGTGFLLGAALLAVFGFVPAVLGMAAVLTVG